jgi:hypothetical protein
VTSMTSTPPERRGPLRLTLEEARAHYRTGVVEYRDHHVQEDVDGFPLLAADDPVQALVYWPPATLGWPEDLLEADDEEPAVVDTKPEKPKTTTRAKARAKAKPKAGDQDGKTDQ